MSGDNSTEPIDASTTEKLEYEIRLFERAPQKLAIIAVAAVAVGIVGYVMFQHILLAVVGFFAILFATAEFWMPVRYVLDEKGATARCGMSTTAIEWSDIRRVVVGEEGIKLSPLEDSGKLSPFRGVFLRDGHRREDVLAWVRRSVASDVRFL